MWLVRSSAETVLATGTASDRGRVMLPMMERDAESGEQGGQWNGAD
ncbi:MAG: hypothetical protein K0S28_1461, partial [Paucimonas sp.]|nr:hypothetical protein [Paucimonas sp.]